MSTAESFRADVESFLERTGMSPSRFGAMAVGDANFVANLRAGRNVGLRILDVVTAFMAQAESATDKPKNEPAGASQ